MRAMSVGWVQFAPSLTDINTHGIVYSRPKIRAVSNIKMILVLGVP
jgi:hypothetical protein